MKALNEFRERFEFIGDLLDVDTPQFCQSLYEAEAVAEALYCQRIFEYYGERNRLCKMIIGFPVRPRRKLAEDQRSAFDILAREVNPIIRGLCGNLRPGFNPFRSDFLEEC